LSPLALHLPVSFSHVLSPRASAGAIARPAPLSQQGSMPPLTTYDPISTVQQAIAALLSAQEPRFIGIGNRLFVSFAVILLVWQGIRMMLA
jgi:hypothetical protein